MSAKSHRGHNEGSILERKNAAGEVASFQARVTVAGGRRSQSFKSKAEARRWMTTARAEAVQGRLNPRRPPTLAEYLSETWLPSIEDKVKTRTHVSIQPERFARPSLAGLCSAGRAEAGALPALLQRTEQDEQGAAHCPAGPHDPTQGAQGCVEPGPGKPQPDRGSSVAACAGQREAVVQRRAAGAALPGD